MISFGGATPANKSAAKPLGHNWVASTTSSGGNIWSAHASCETAGEELRSKNTGMGRNSISKLRTFQIERLPRGAFGHPREHLVAARRTLDAHRGEDRHEIAAARADTIVGPQAVGVGI